MAVAKAMKDNLQACRLVPNVLQQAFANLGYFLSNSIRDSVKSLSSTNLVLSKRNVLSAAAGHLSWMRMPCETELHANQQCNPSTTRLYGSGEDVHQVLSKHPWKKGKRHIRNGLR
jgi:hypothetical protein